MIAVRSGEAQGLLTNTQMSPLIMAANGSATVWSVMNAAYTRLAMQQLAPETAQFPQAQPPPVLRWRLAVSPGVATLHKHRKRIGNVPGGVEIDEVRRRALVGTGNLVINAVVLARDRRKGRLPLR